MPARTRTKTGPRAATSKPAAKTGYINARVQPKLKKDAEKIFDQIGISTSDAVTVFLKQVVLQRGLPFPVRVPNAETIAALEAAERGETTAYTGSTKAMLDSILSEQDD